MLILILIFLGPYLQEALETFVVGHWSVSRQITSRHLSASRENLIFLNKESSFPAQGYTWLVENLSREGDVVIDAGTPNGCAMVAALRKGRSAVRIDSTALPSEQAAIETKICSLVSS